MKPPIEQALEQTHSPQSAASQAQFLHTAKLTTLGEMATGLAHELNQPLNNIKVIAQSVIRNIKKQRALDLPKLHEELDIMIAQINRMSTTIEHLRQFSVQKVQDPPEPTDIHGVIDGALEFIAALLRFEQIDIQKEYAPDLPQVFINRSQMEQVFLNLFHNAKDALLENKVPVKRLVLRTRAVAEHIQVEVEDTGGGIPAPIREKIFQPFFSTKAVDKGTGMGLSASWGIVKSNGGSLTFKVQEGVGTTFLIQLPIKTYNKK